eukprot:CAMPEP_0206553830 /NCGR_PEP_ID=MMETSP0325_2-20121206/16844_1 /ASSEMBLY_ACC=CAM_ASM_000347 /TAXON_ID=2866 /ORGANISM="Crypthecodinium cohnii, Strain Seligo" /LENGTH=781 /DNA_ID=CAMNT_0054053839 /DNA_START=66 /DNA_END=2408 /DNA_ORIENTATION=-
MSEDPMDYQIRVMGMPSTKTEEETGSMSTTAKMGASETESSRNGGIGLHVPLPFTLPIPRSVERADAMAPRPPLSESSPANYKESSADGKESVVDAACSNATYDVFLSHLQRNAQDAVISLQMFLQQARPGIKCFIDLDVDMKGDLTGTLRDGVINSSAFIFFITDGILESEWCAQELRWAVQYEKNIVLVRETDTRHGGLDMKEFFPQVPEDLLEVFKNTIAIPWYREPAFRSVSIESILKACQLEDTFAQDLERLADIRQNLTAIFKRNTETSTCLDVMERNSWAIRVVLIIGGFHRFKSPRVDTMYALIFNFSFWLCGTLCAANLVYQCVPFQLLMTDALTAYVHFPAWQSWYCWRAFVKSHGADELLARVMADPERAYTVGVICRVCGWIILIVQTAMVCDVLAGFSLPGTMGYLEVEGAPHMHGGHFPDAGGDTFAYLHAFLMWVVIPPVIASMFASYSMFAFIALLHFLDARSMYQKLLDTMSMLGSFFNLADTNKVSFSEMPDATPSCRDDAPTPTNKGSGTPVHRTISGSTNQATEDSQSQSEQPFASGRTASSLLGGIVGTLASDGLAGQSIGGQSTLSPSTAANRANATAEEERHHAAMERELCQMAVDVVRMLFDGVQLRIDHTCECMGNLWLHLVFFSTCQVLAITASLQNRVANSEVYDSYTWWWALQDFFHLGGGLTLLVVSMAIFCVVTAYLRAVYRSLGELCGIAGCPPSITSTLLSMVSRDLGMHILGKNVYIDATQALNFGFVIVVVVMNATITVVNSLNGTW